MTDADPQGRGTAPSRLSTRRPRRRGLWVAASVVATAVIVATGAILLWPEDEAPSDARVAVLEEFFDALAERDTETALSLVQPDSLPAEANSRFLVPEAIGEGWRLLSATVLEESDDLRKVHAEFSTPAGEARGDYEVRRQPDDTWLLGAVFTPVVFQSSPATYVQVNELLMPASELYDDPRQYVFPGVYEFYGTVPGVVEVSGAEPVELFWPQSFEDSVDVAAPSMSLGSDALETVQDSLDDLVEDCLESTSTRPEQCPFGLGEDYEVQSDDEVLTASEDAEWTLDHEVTVTGATYERNGWASSFIVETDLPETPVTLTAEVDGRPATAACEFSTEALVVELHAVDGEIVVETTSRTPDPAETKCEIL